MLFNLFGCKNSKKSEKNDSSEMTEAAKLAEKHAKAFLNRKIYKVLTSEIIDSVEDNNLVQTVMDNIWEKMDSEMSNELEVFKSLTKEQQAIYVIWLVEAEVNNGGFNQFYYNSSGQFAARMEESFVEIGAIGFAEIAKRANVIHKENYEEITGEMDGSIESFSESYEDNPLNELDTEFYNQYETEKLSELMVKYIRDNNEKFIDY